MDNTTVNRNDTVKFLDELFGSSTELRYAINDAKVVVETFLEASVIVGYDIGSVGTERLQKIILLFDYLMED